MVKKTLCAALLCTALAGAEPTGPSVTHGNVQIQTQGATTQIIQATDRAIIQWNGFSINANELVRFLQPNSAAVILNRVIGANPSQILGQIQANGRVFLVNPNGIVFGAGSQVNVGGLLATTLQLSDQDFLQGNYHLTQDPNHALASVVNRGELHIAEGGFLVLAAPVVSNEGLIVAQSGQVGLIGAQQTTVNFDGMGLIEVSVPSGRPGSPGAVVMPANAVSQIFQGVVTNPGIPELANLAGAEGLVVQQGSIDTSGSQSGGQVILHSSQASLITSSSQIVANSSRTPGEVHLLSEGQVYSSGSIQAGRGAVELTGTEVSWIGPIDVGGATAGQILVNAGGLTLVESLPIPVETSLASILNYTPNLVSRSNLEAQPAGSQISLHSSNGISLEDIPSDLIALRSGVALNLSADQGNLTFHDPQDTLAVGSGGSIRIQLAAGGSTSLGNLVAPSGEIHVSAATDLAVQLVDTSGGEVDLRTGGDLSLGQIVAGSARLGAGGDILDLHGSAANVVANEASFVAGGTVGLPTNPVSIDVNVISGEAEDFFFQELGPVTEGLVYGIQGLHRRKNLEDPFSETLDEINDVPVFELNDSSSGGGGGGDWEAESPDEELGQAALLEDFSHLPQLAVLSPTMMVLQGNQASPLIDELTRQGWQVEVSQSLLLARKGDLQLVGRMGSVSTPLTLVEASSQAEKSALNDALDLLREFPEDLLLTRRGDGEYLLSLSAPDSERFWRDLSQHGWRVDREAGTATKNALRLTLTDSAQVRLERSH
ncbi:filamentous hemagglutinin N-terminal domain-containing protein [bacterium]|nr:filamentous hemagglutinin N-terminal domain-containing protein [bacterium]